MNPDILNQSKSVSRNEASLIGDIENKPSMEIISFPNPAPEMEYLIDIESSELTFLCPKSGQPEFVKLSLSYIPDRKCVDTRSWKKFIWSYRDKALYRESLISDILTKFVESVSPGFVQITGVFNIRGGIEFTIETEHRKEKEHISSVASGINNHKLQRPVPRDGFEGAVMDRIDELEIKFEAMQMVLKSMKRSHESAERVILEVSRLRDEGKLFERFSGDLGDLEMLLDALKEYEEQ